jgi:hypothetical protein
MELGTRGHRHLRLDLSTMGIVPGTDDSRRDSYWGAGDVRATSPMVGIFFVVLAMSVRRPSFVVIHNSF